MSLTKEKILIHALFGIKSVLKDLGVEDVNNEVTLEDGTKETVNCYKEIEEFIIDYVNSKDQQENEWIPFTEDKDGILNCPLPDDEQDILVSDGETIWNDTFINDDNVGCYLAYNNLDLLGLAWMPFPKPYNKSTN